jgi:hypothetical protein
MDVLFHTRYMHKSSASQGYTVRGTLWGHTARGKVIGSQHRTNQLLEVEAGDGMLRSRKDAVVKLQGGK